MKRYNMFSIYLYVIAHFSVLSDLESTLKWVSDNVLVILGCKDLPTYNRVYTSEFKYVFIPYMMFNLDD